MALLLLVFSFVLPNLVCAKVAVVKVSGVVVLGMKAGGMGDGDPLKEWEVGEEDVLGWLELEVLEPTGCTVGGTSGS